MINTICVVSPPIQQFFDRFLLSRPTAKLRDTAETLWTMIQEIQSLWYKLDSNPIRKARCEKLLREITQNYERAQIKEKERESQTDHKTQEFGYSFAGFEKMEQDVYWRLRFGRKTGAHRFK